MTLEGMNVPPSLLNQFVGINGVPSPISSIVGSYIDDELNVTEQGATEIMAAANRRIELNLDRGIIDVSSGKMIEADCMYWLKDLNEWSKKQTV